MSVSLLVSNVQVTGSQIIFQPNLTGIGGTLVLQSGNFVLISGAGNNGGGGGSGDVTLAQLNSLSGFTTGVSGYLQQQINNISGGGGSSILNFSFVSPIPSGAESYFVGFQPTFGTPPIIGLTLETTGPALIYASSISGRSITGFWALFSDVVTESGLYLNVLVEGSQVNSGIAYVSGVPTGVDQYFFAYPNNFNFAITPKICATWETTFSNNIYGLSISGRNVSGFWALFSDVVLETGYFLDIIAKY